MMNVDRVMKNYLISVLWNEDKKMYIAKIDGFPYATTHGKTYDEALTMAQDSLRISIEYKLKNKQPLPTF